MALDGITVKALCSELNSKIIGSRIYKIAQPEADEILLTLKGSNGQLRLLLCADASLPFAYLTDENKVSPDTAPGFCMLLRKHLQNGRIVSVRQPSLERILMFDIEHLDEMGDLKFKTLIIELMGKHSNIIFIDDNNQIIDSIKHINASVSSVREVLPGREYFIPNTEEKIDPFCLDKDSFITRFTEKALPASKAIYTTLTGFSPIMSEEILFRAGIDSDMPVNSLDTDNIDCIYNELCKLISKISANDFAPSIIYDKNEPVEFAAVSLSVYSDKPIENNDSISYVLRNYYSKKNIITRIRQKSADLRKIVQTLLERNVKKYDLQLKQLKDAAKKDKYKVYGELLNTYGYSAALGDKEITCDNYYTGESITIPLDPTKSAIENAKKYFDKYTKLKRTEDALIVQSEATKREIDHLESIAASIDIAVKESDLSQIKEEMIDYGYVKRKGPVKKVKITSKPLHYISSDGYDIYVGKNNYQNDELTFKFANGGDWWFHAKKMPGSHVIVKSGGKELPDRVFEEAAALAAYYSSGRNMNKVEIDYVLKKEVKKPSGAAPGFVVYYTNYSMIATPDISSLNLAGDN